MPHRAAKDALISALSNTGLLTVLQSESSPTRIRLLCRVSDKPKWLLLLERILRIERTWSDHICQQHFLRDNRMVYGWNITISGDSIHLAAGDIVALLKPRLAPTEVMEVPLTGAERNNNSVSWDPRAPGLRSGGQSHRGAFGVGG